MTTPSAIEQAVAALEKCSVRLPIPQHISQVNLDELTQLDNLRVAAARNALSTLRAISASGTHAVVPLKPTVAMITAAENAQAARYFAKEAGKIVPHKEHEVIIWDAMLTAAPKVGE